MNEIKMSFAICEECGKFICVLQGGYLTPEELNTLGLCQESSNHPSNPPDTRFHEFKDMEDAQRRYGDWLNDPRLKPGMLKAYAIIRRKSQVQN